MQVERRIDFSGQPQFDIPAIVDWCDFEKLVALVAQKLHGTVMQKMDGFDVIIWEVLFGYTTIISFSIDIWMPMAIHTKKHTNKEKYHLTKVINFLEELKWTTS
jgi:hypothetical protein